MSQSASKRLLSIDLLRGYFLLVIIIDHLGRFPNGLEWLTGRGALWVTAAEGFFFVSGFILGLTSVRKIAKVGFGPIWRKLWQRSLWLYVLTVVATLGFTLWAFHLGFSPKGGLIDTNHWPTIIQRAVTLQYSYGWHDFLPRYAIYLLAAPLAAYLLHRRLWWAVVWGSFLVWAYFGRTSFNNAWQIIFFLGMVIGYHYPDIKQWFSSQSAAAQIRLKAATISAALFTLSAAVAICLVPFLLYDYGPWTRPVFASVADIDAMHWLANSLRQINLELSTIFSHARMGLGRVVLFLIWIGAAFIITQRFDRQIKAVLGWLLLPMGRNSLLTYLVHAVVIFIIDIQVLRQPGIKVALGQTLLAIGMVWLSVVVIKYGPYLASRSVELAGVRHEISLSYNRWRRRLQTLSFNHLTSSPAMPISHRLVAWSIAVTAALLVVPVLIIRIVQNIVN